MLDFSPLKECVRKLFLENQWSPEQISQRIKLENNGESISYNTIYRAIYRGLFNDGFVKGLEGSCVAKESLKKALLTDEDNSTMPLEFTIDQFQQKKEVKSVTGKLTQ